MIKMNEPETGNTDRIHTAQRIIGAYDKNIPGPLFICIGGIHGNEPAGVKALQRVFAKLIANQPRIRGKFIAFRGNLSGLAQKQRYIDKDLNRMWLPERMAALENGEMMEPLNNEEAEQIELFQVLQNMINEAQHQVYVLDLHTTSSASKPFAIFGDTLRNRKFAKKLHAPLILGLEEAIAGTLIEHLTNLGYMAIAFEAGQHDAENSVDIHEAAVWLALATTGMINRKNIANYQQFVERLARETNKLPQVLEVCYRHAIHEEDEFRMAPGFVNFQPVRQGQLLAHDKNDWIWAPKKYHVFMPLYQGLGDDGFFLARPVWPVWLTVSKWLRRIKLDTLMHYLPGVEKQPGTEHAFRINTRIARWLVMEIFHLLGYRRERKENGVLVVSKRKYDFIAPCSPKNEN
jgi:succinylglutamate desuccinylase